MKYVLAASLLIATLGSAQIVPADRIVDWTPGVAVGVPGGIPTNRTNLIDVTKAPYHADNTGVTNAGPAVQSAINATASGTVVYLPAGTYRFNSGISINKSGITVRGAGSNTVVNMYGSAGFAYVGSASDYQWKYPSTNNWVTAGLTKGSTTITVANTTGFGVGKLVHLAIANDPNLPVVHVSNYPELRQQLTRITAMAGNALTIYPPLYFDYSGVAVRACVAQQQANFVGLEDLTLNSTNSTGMYVVWFEQTYGCWIKNVHSRYAANYHFFLYDALQCEVRESFLDILKNSGPNGAGLLMNRSSANLIENNIVYKAFPLIEVNQGSCGNVFGYNYLEDSSVGGVIGAGLDSNHGPHNFLNLYEGNIAPNLQCDGYYGSASHDTVFRNWFHGTVAGIAGFGNCVTLNRFTRNYSLVGNILGKPGIGAAKIYSFGLPNMGNSFSSGFAPPWANWGTAVGATGFQELDTNVVKTTLLKGNFNYATNGIPAGESLGGTSLPPSLYRASKPAWFGNLNWPPFNPAAPSPSNGSIPAGARYLAGTIPATPITPPILNKPIITPGPE